MFDFAYQVLPYTEGILVVTTPLPWFYPVEPGVMESTCTDKSMSHLDAALRDVVLGSALGFSLKHMGPPRKFGSPVVLYHGYATKRVGHVYNDTLGDHLQGNMGYQQIRWDSQMQNFYWLGPGTPVTGTRDQKR